ncbi:MAG TPA: GNAT family N-acetyltransferase [Opitutaceae bacterium]|nr:GNAT family N-acetyltransferase [Opitutaceae bacterium]
MNADPPLRPSLRGLRDDEIGFAYEIYLQACAWLKGKGVRQWLTPKPRATFEGRQARGENFGLFLGSDLAVIVTLSLEVHEYWRGELGGEGRWWLHTLAVAPGFRGRRLGEEAVAAAASLLRSKAVPELYLDCGADGILPAYYGRLGFGTLANKAITYPSGNTYPIVLMRMALAPG